MGSLTSGLIKEIVTQKLKKTILSDVKPQLWMRYVDGTFLIIKRVELQRTLDHRRIFHGNQIHYGDNMASLPFLDVLITWKNTTTLETLVYRKKKHRG